MSEDIVVTGVLPPGRFGFRPATARADGRLDTTSYRFDAVTASGVEFDLDEVRVHDSGSRFDACTFRQDPRRAKANRQKFAYSYSHVLLGMQSRSTYRDCVFDHVDFGLGGGGARPLDARFESCVFRHCAFRHFDADDADFLDCTFVGTINSARFHGHADRAQPNVFAGNDLTRAKLRRVEFRGVDLRDSRLPTGPEYLRVDDFRTTARAARHVLAQWPEAEREKAEWLLRLYEERWSEPLFQWRTFLAGRDSRLWPLLESYSAARRG